MGNPAMDRKKKTERRRKKYEQRLGPGVYLPREERLKFNAEVEKAVAEARKAKLEKLAQKQKKNKAKTAEAK
jgi:hypothetical protein